MIRNEGKVICKKITNGSWLNYRLTEFHIPIYFILTAHRDSLGVDAISGYSAYYKGAETAIFPVRVAKQLLHTKL